jgi:hypothetical protein
MRDGEVWGGVVDLPQPPKGKNRTIMGRMVVEPLGRIGECSPDNPQWDRESNLGVTAGGTEMALGPLLQAC